MDQNRTQKGQDNEILVQVNLRLDAVGLQTDLMGNSAVPNYRKKIILRNSQNPYLGSLTQGLRAIVIESQGEASLRQ